MTHNPIIYITGFGPFQNQPVNASWEAVRLLPSSIEYEGKIFQIKKVEIPVIYEAANKIVPTIWDDNPTLVIHCGVSGTRSILLEKCSYNRNYSQLDVDGKRNGTCSLLKNGKTSDGYCACLTTNLNVESYVADLKECGINFDVSEEPGSYLCGYIYLKSLDFDKDRTLFIHVPMINSPYSSSQTSQGIQMIINKCIGQLKVENKL